MTKQQRGPRLALAICCFLLFHLPTNAFDREYCEFGTNDYSLEWAYEPNTEKIVFVLKMNASDPEFWTGVGFNGSRSSVDFVGVLVRNGQVVMADAYLNGSGVLYTDVVSNIQTIGHEYDGKHLLVKFARALNSPDMVNDQSLDGCTTFLLPREVGKIEAQGIQPKLNEFHRFKVCDIKKHCSIDMSATVASKAKIAKKPISNDHVKFAKSVDISGDGDPCSFAGKDYIANWTYDKPTERIQFTMQLPVKAKKWWSSVGIGEFMTDMDVGVLFLEDGKVKKVGDYLSSSYNAPDEDSHNDWKLESSVKSGKTATVKFSRAIKTEDKNDRTMEGCVFFQFGANLGKYGDKYSIHKHEDWPDLYKACDLREHCAELSFEKRAKNRKNKNEEEEAPQTDENNDKKEDKIAVTEEAETPNAEVTTPSELTTAQEEKSKTTEASEISEEIGSGEEPENASTIASIKSTEISLDDSSGQEHEDETTVSVPSKLVTSAAETTTSGETSTVSQTKQDISTTTKNDSTTVLTTLKPLEEIGNSTTSNAINSTRRDSKQCDPQKQDLVVCQSYFDNYLAQVREWAARHEETMEAQYGKACALLSAIPNVPTLCCNIFQKTCNAQISN